MSQVISFDDYRPPARFDAVPWTQAIVQEAATASGTWASIDTLALSPVDPDPATPQLRSFTTSAASDELGLWYRIVFADGAANLSQPTDPVQNLANTPYVTREEIKALLSITADDFDDDAIDTAIEGASRSCDGYKKTRFYPTTETRYYSPNQFDAAFEIDDLNALTSLAVDTDGDGVHETTWTRGVDFVLDPANAELEGRPFDTVTLLRLAGREFPDVQRSVKIVGSFGWAATPALVKDAAILLANRFLTRMKQAPLGILVATANEMVATARLGRIDPDAAFLLDQVVGRSSGSGLTSLRLG